MNSEPMPPDGSNAETIATLGIFNRKEGIYGLLN